MLTLSHNPYLFTQRRPFHPSLTLSTRCLPLHPTLAQHFAISLSFPPVETVFLFACFATLVFHLFAPVVHALGLLLLKLFFPDAGLTCNTVLRAMTVLNERLGYGSDVGDGPTLCGPTICGGSGCTLRLPERLQNALQVWMMLRVRGVRACVHTSARTAHPMGQEAASTPAGVLQV